ncbi:MAG: hypothetical protein KDB14_29290 [Planctomycetales bacterium]|nr:hypothetical protein [Planctomycetales bacterium]
MHFRTALLLIPGLLWPQVSSAQVATPGTDILRSTQELLPPIEEPDGSQQSQQLQPRDLPPTARLDAMSAAQDSSDHANAPSPFSKVSDTEPAPALTPQMQNLRAKILAVLSLEMNKPRFTTQHSPWGIMHAMHAFGVETLVVNEHGQQVNAAGWLAWNQACRGRTMMYLDNSNQLELRIGPGYQGHDGQFLALLAQSRVMDDFELRVGNRALTVADLVEHEKRTCRPGTELTFKLIGLAHYLGPDAKWSNQFGAWDIPRLIEEELRQPVVGAACGGTHRLFGHSYALNRARKANIPIDGSWQRASQFTLQYQQRAIGLQNPDGSFSTEWFKARGMSSDIERRLQTTGHILEWMVFSLPQVDMQDERIVRSVDYLASLMLQHRNQAWEVGPRGHAIRALALYDQRVFGGMPGQLEKRLAKLVPNHRTVR